MNFIKKYSFSIGLIIFALILTRIDFLKLISILSQINYLYLILATLLALPMLLVKTYRWNYLKKKQNIHYSLKDSFLMYGTGMYIGILTPGRLGDLSKIFYLKKDNYSLGKSAVSVILDRTFDLFFLLVFSYIGMFFFFSFFQSFILLLTLLIFLGLILLIIALRTNLIKISLKKLFSFMVPAKYRKSWKFNFQDFFNDLRIYKTKDYLFIFLVTGFSWFIYYLQMFWLARSIDITNISFFFLAIAVTVSGFITLLPISILGIGTRDAILILLFSFFLISQESAVSFSALVLLMAAVMGLLGFVCWLRKPISFLG